MTVVQALSAYVVAAGLLTITPGLDTALILRTAAVEGPKRAVFAALGINIGCLIWGAAVALGLGALLAASTLAFDILKWVGAAYLVWLGLNLLLKPRDRFEIATGQTRGGGDLTWMRRGLLTNLLNPKIGIFYVSFLPQFLPTGVQAAPFIFLLAVIHVLIGSCWSGVLIAGTRPIAGVLQRAAVVRWLDRVTGGVFVAFGVRLALERR
ncbi:MAG: LysE family translocator [Alphaproteobacteria bacterium]|nr:LysE family translocator [Alphaproteobacteria bacterium]MBU1514601.1 LysE family translocator [Alphaproteobacteria bacterium]MBU2096767.1 LysE family translocator [Alphaproteobacteria bacterium]MBU2150399.1 LysE family translocator [Alphaproteobacteria bacterium]MBU2306600.1 LysE family translocator [Alphaproteobacteria bacterium]